MPNYDIEHYQRMREVGGIAAGCMISCLIKGQKQGNFKGDVPDAWKQCKGEIQVFGWNQNIFSPVDEAQGQLVGRRVHSPFEFIGKLSQALPMLYTAISTNESITQLTLSVWSQAKMGQGASAAKEYTVELTNANCCRVGIVNSDHEPASYYRAAFTYEKITWTWINGGITASDSWVSGVS